MICIQHVLRKYSLNVHWIIGNTILNESPTENIIIPVLDNHASLNIFKVLQIYFSMKSVSSPVFGFHNNFNTLFSFSQENSYAVLVSEFAMIIYQDAFIDYPIMPLQNDKFSELDRNVESQVCHFLDKKTRVRKLYIKIAAAALNTNMGSLIPIHVLLTILTYNFLKEQESWQNTKLLTHTKRESSILSVQVSFLNL